MKKLILGVLMLLALASCNSSTTVEGALITKVENTSIDTQPNYWLETAQGGVIWSSSNHNVGDMIAIVPVTISQFKLPMRDAETRQCLNYDTVVITNTVCIDCDGPGTSDTTIHYYKSKHP